MIDENLKNLEYALIIAGFEKNNSNKPKNYAKCLEDDWNDLIVNRQSLDKKTKSRNLVMEKINKKDFSSENFFDIAAEYAPEFIHISNDKLSTLFSKTRSSFNVANNHILSIVNNNFDTPTNLGYFGFTKIFYVYRFLENFCDYLNCISNIPDRENNSVGVYNAKGLFLDFVKKLNKNELLKSLFIDIHLEKNYKGESIFSYIDEKQKLERMNKGLKDVSYVNQSDFNLNLKYATPMALINDLRHLFVHSKISASSGSGNPLINFTLTSYLSDIVLKEAEDFFKNKILIEKYLYEF